MHLLIFTQVYEHLYHLEYNYIFHVWELLERQEASLLFIHEMTPRFNFTE